VQTVDGWMEGMERGRNLYFDKTLLLNLMY
jgi:hypothetical protein